MSDISISQAIAKENPLEIARKLVEQLTYIQEELNLLGKYHQIKDVSADEGTNGLSAAYLAMKTKHAIQNFIEKESK